MERENARKGDLIVIAKKAKATNNRMKAMDNKVEATGSKAELMEGMTAVMVGVHRGEIITAVARPLTGRDMEEDPTKVDTHNHSKEEVGTGRATVGTEEAKEDLIAKRVVMNKARATARIPELRTAGEAATEAEATTIPAQCITLSSTQAQVETETCSSRSLARLEGRSSIFKTRISMKGRLFRRTNRCMGTKAEAEAQLTLRAWAWLRQCKL